MSFVHVAVSNVARILFVKVVVVVLIKKTQHHYITFNNLQCMLHLCSFVCLFGIFVGWMFNE